MYILSLYHILLVERNFQVLHTHKGRDLYKGRDIRRQRSWDHLRNCPPQMGSSLPPNQWMIHLRNPILESASSDHYPYQLTGQAS